MAYSPPRGPRAIAASSLKAALVGAFLITIFVGSSLLLSNPNYYPGLFGALFTISLIFAIAFVAGVIATATSLLLLGTIIARFARSILKTNEGLALTVASAIFASMALGLLLDPWFTLIALPYALPAAWFYRQEILLEDFLATTR